MFQYSTKASVLEMLDLLLWIFWFILGANSFWFFTQAKKLRPLTLDELVILWKLHKQQTECDAPISKMEPIINTQSYEFVSFKCECDYRYLSKRLITQRDARKLNMFSQIRARKEVISEVARKHIQRQI